MPSTCIRDTARLVPRKLLREDRPEKEGRSRPVPCKSEEQAYKRETGL
jgi:hypothetical protein